MPKIKFATGRDKNPDIASLMGELARFALEENISSLTSSGGIGGR